MGTISGTVLPSRRHPRLEFGSVPPCVQKRLKKTSGHGKRLIEIYLRGSRYLYCIAES